MDGPRECPGCKRTWLFETESEFSAHVRACLEGTVSTLDPLTGLNEIRNREVEAATAPANLSDTPQWPQDPRYWSTGISTGYDAIRHIITAPRQITSTMMPAPILVPSAQQLAEMRREAAELEIKQLIERQRLVREAADRREELRKRQIEKAEQELREKAEAARRLEEELEATRQALIAQAARIEADCHLCRAFRELKDCIDLDGTAPSRCLDCMERTAKARGWITDAERAEWEQRKAVVNAMNERLNKGTPWEEFMEWWAEWWQEWDEALSTLS